MVMKVYLKLMLALVCVLGSSGRAAPLEATGVGFRTTTARGRNSGLC